MVDLFCWHGYYLLLIRIKKVIFSCYWGSCFFAVDLNHWEPFHKNFLIVLFPHSPFAVSNGIYLTHLTLITTSISTLSLRIVHHLHNIHSWRQSAFWMGTSICLFSVRSYFHLRQSLHITYHNDPDIRPICLSHATYVSDFVVISV